MSAAYVLGLDLGTTGNRAILFDRQGNIAHQAYRELTQYYPRPGWLEHDPSHIWSDTRWAIQTVLSESGVNPTEIAAVGLTVQRETCLLWDKTTGQPLHNAIVWQDRRTAPLCNKLRQEGRAQDIFNRTGLVLDAYFSATKLAWLLDKVKEQHPGINLDNVLAGTVDTWVLWNLTGGNVHSTDHSNASRTMLLNLGSNTWDPELLDLFGIPAHFMPAIHPSIGEVARLDPSICGVDIPVAAVLGDQQAALYAHGCDRPGSLKCTYGTGCFLVAHTGNQLSRSENQLLSTVAWSQTNPSGNLSLGYALEGSTFTGGACIQWLRDGIKIIDSAPETATLAQSIPDTGGVYFVPALSGLGAPHWDMTARGSFFGITGGTQRAHMARAVLEAIAYQVCEIVEAVANDNNTPITTLKVDGGACNNDFLMQFQADVSGAAVERPEILDATAQGAAFAAGLAVGFWDDYHTLVSTRQVDRIFKPSTDTTTARQGYAAWKEAVSRTKNWQFA